MKVLFITIDDESRASSRVRVYNYFPYLKDKGLTYSVIPWNAKYRIKPFSAPSSLVENIINFVVVELLNYLVMTTRIVWALLFIRRYDVIFVQKLKLRRLSWWLRLNKKRIIYDLVDAPYATHSKEQKKYVKPSTDLINMLKISDQVIVENTLNEQFARQYCAKVQVILGPIDTNRYKPSIINSNSEIITIGWIGSNDNTYYLLAIQNVLERLCLKYPKVTVKLIGSKNFVTKEPKITQLEWAQETECQELATFDIGIMPLSDDIWAQSKGGYKILQYMSIGIPTVATPVGINRNLLVEDDIGFAVNTNDEWEEKLSMLIEDYNLRAKLGLNARKIAVEKYSLEKSCEKFCSIVKSIQNV